ncbi:UDP-N-acetylglucosamine-N-acetylmuramylpentapeptide N-acetylglucosamine transferase [Desulfonatronum thiosulfatophilum]|uniref:UDP-N-acetylglucosamine--N-acetylmuramyl-(pentapeptide) pyrophosphoryl-undecaprenol N-acetylglucosamine transferase n=1 Tax=Desulfonatronum thiosulfatophilum TaxID=617002 RepID=A0A1G6AN92_9BACT|nr:undecaprenyldiphospho-muramoylpentapeptide beta-N-acetylglucosaminyltransferase [Desulfonatronum thiosulfatophilum]SDB09852.1 UDP-N-acetylglucosamine-N-acetylmuramylpentapeptide N-acetylglucosamine transferase [Desulfonatronum thiosulfatophilum]
MNRVILTTGGTGGHIFPALAVAEELRARHPAIELLFVGGTRGPEGKLASQAGLAFEALPVAGVLGRGWRALGILGWLPRSVVQAMGILRRFKPDVVLGLGGYAGFSTVLAAWMSRIPTAIHEQNGFPGMTNRLLGRLVRKVLLSLPDERGFFDPDKVVYTGNPLRQAVRELRTIEPAGESPRRNVLILGGSQGAKAINQAVLESLDGFQEERISLWHQTGPADLERVANGYSQAGWDKARVEPFIDNVAEAYGWADLVVCRAGATTLAELTAMGKPSVLIPFPYATHNHQMLNARHLEQAGAAMVLMESYLARVQLWAVVKDLLDIPGKLRDMSKSAWELGRPDAGAAVVRELEGLVHGT